MITMSIFWALVFALFATKVQQPNKYQKKSKSGFVRVGAGMTRCWC